MNPDAMLQVSENTAPSPLIGDSAIRLPHVILGQNGRKQPRAHQDQAVKAIVSALSKCDRATAIMPCGSGKTLVQLWVAESMNPETILVLVPSLALVSQSLREWHQEARWKSVAYLVVCHDETVHEFNDESTDYIADLNIAVTTQPHVIQDFLTSTAEATIKVIFCTYHSVLALSVGLPDGMWVDLAVFDEAHRTAGYAGKLFATALKDDAVRIRRRLFMTATPRHYQINDQGTDAEIEPLFSMDDENVYGPVAYHLPHREAIRRNIILPYKVIIPVITSGRVNLESVQHTGVTIEQSQADMRTVGCQLAISDAVERYHINKVITFHESVSAAVSFTGNGKTGIARYLPDTSCLHVNGAMPAGERTRILEELRQAPRAVISNQRCLTEGVDVPSVDMVAFLSPKRSVVDITQAIGRTTRISAGKTCGYVLIPLLVEHASDESLSRALSHSEFGAIWEVLQSILERDAATAESYFTPTTKPDAGRGTEMATVRLFDDQVEFISDDLTIDQLKQSIVAHVLSVLHVPWEINFERLKVWQARTGHCLVTRDTAENERLAIWVNRQRQACKRAMLSNKKIQKLDSLGMVWDLRTTAWENRIRKILSWKANEHCGPDEGKHDIMALMARLRAARKKNRVPDWVVKRLDEAGFAWSPYDVKWEEKYQQLAIFARQHGHCNLKSIGRPHKKLLPWSHRQRIAKKNGKLCEVRINRLNEIGFEWDPIDESWETMFQKLLPLKKTGLLAKLGKRWPDDPQLGVWANSQRHKMKAGTLAVECIERLEAIGFCWSLRKALWESRYDELIRYKELHGHCQVLNGDAEYYQLSLWVTVQRREYRAGKMGQERILQLNAIGFDWSPPRFRK